jgi:hypothetical protein
VEAIGMRFSKFDLVAIAVVVGGALLVEYCNHITINAPTPEPVSALDACVPFSAECMAFLLTPPAGRKAP